MGKDGTAVLCSDVIALAHALGRIVPFPERLEDLGIGYLLRVKDHPHSLGVTGQAATHLFVSGIGRVPALIAYRRHPDARQAPEEALRAPEASQREVGDFQVLGIGRQQHAAVEMMSAGLWQCRGSTRQRFRSRWQAQFLVSKEHDRFLLRRHPKAWP